MKAQEESTQENEFVKEIEHLYRLHYITKNHDHIIELKRGEWRLFEPSKFIYAYFAFNSFYNFHWEECLKNNKLELFTKTIVNENECEPSEGTKYKSMIDFIFSYKIDKDVDEFFKIVCTGLSNEQLNKIISNITPDDNITFSERNKFKIEFEKLLQTRVIRVGKLKNDIVRFIYLVRNNIFHGTKNTIEMSESFQRKRLKVYTNILIGLNQMLFNILERETDFQPHGRYTISSKI